MSATLDPAPVAAFLGGCPVIEVAGRPHPVEIAYDPRLSPVDAARSTLARPGGHAICFLPGAPEIQRAHGELRSLAADPSLRVLPLHGSLSSREQDAALAPCAERKLILATNIAETSLTVEGVTDVIDSGLHKVLRRDPARGIDRLETERIPLDSADQRAGRAGRTGPGRALRLWDPREKPSPSREPEIERVDLAGPFLDVLAWGGDPLRFDWFHRPPEEGSRAAMELLERLGAMRGGRITDLGRRLRRVPLHPRLARVLLDAGGSAAGAAACAAIAEGWVRDRSDATTRSDLLALADRIDEAPPRVRRAARELSAMGRRLAGRDAARHARREREEDRLLRAVLAGYPDRVARRREPRSPRLLLATGHGARLGRESGVREAELLIAVDLVAGARGPGSEARVRIASAVEADWLEPTGVEIVHELDEQAGAVRASERVLYDRLTLGERPVEPDPECAARLLADRLLARGLGPEANALVRRLRFACLELDVEATVREACHGHTRLPRIDLEAWLPFETRRALDRLAPTSITLPSGRTARLEYADDGTVHASAKLQELFGMADTPRIGEHGEPVTFRLLAPNGRPVQTTRDLRSFWERTYPEVRKELRGRYPRHAWPEDPWSATPHFK
jgi:ATP-dependent helicase HrpB